MLTATDKGAILEALRDRVTRDLDAITKSQQETQAGATHEEAKAEGDKDMRSTETSYLARGLAKRVVELQEAASLLATLRLRSFAEDSAVALTALVELEDEEGERGCYFVAPVGGGRSLTVRGQQVHIVTPGSPMGRALVGLRIDDEAELAAPGGTRFLTVLSIC